MSHSILQILRESRGGFLHVVDPYKIPVEEAVEKARALAALRFALLIVGSTDYTLFDSHMPRYLAALKGAADLRLLLHFPPRKGQGFPICPHADGVLLSCVDNPTDSYFAEQCVAETRALARHRAGPCPEFISSVAYVFGQDDKSFAAVGARPIPTNRPSLDRHAAQARREGQDVVYLYSRHGEVSPAVVRLFRERLLPGQLLFVSGGVRTRERIEQYLRMGADYVVFGSALEGPDWRCVLAAIGAPRGVAEGERDIA